MTANCLNFISILSLCPRFSFVIVLTVIGMGRARANSVCLGYQKLGQNWSIS